MHAHEAAYFRFSSPLISSSIDALAGLIETYEEFISEPL